MHGLKQNCLNTQAPLLGGSVFKILLARETRQKKFEFEDPPNQELSKKKIVLKERHNYIETLVTKSKMSTVFYSIQIYGLQTRWEETKRNIYHFLNNSLQLYFLHIILKMTG